MSRAKVVATYEDGAEEISIDGHQVQFGYGTGGDGYCYAHQSFDCIDNLTDEQMAQIHTAERQQVIPE